MADLMLECRSNHFHVKDPRKFMEFMKGFPYTDFLEPTPFDEGTHELVEIRNDTDPGPERVPCEPFVLSFGESGMPGYRIETNDEDEEVEVQVEFLEELAKYLVPGEVAVVQQAGFEGQRYVVGDAWAVNSDGNIVYITIDDIYKKAAKEFGIEDGRISRAEY